MANIKWLWQYAKLEKRALLITTLIFISLDISYVGIIRIQQEIVDDIFVAGHYEKLLPIMLLFAVIVIIHVSGHVCGAFAYVGPTKRINSKISDDVMQFIQKLPIQSFQKERTAKYVHYFSSDIPVIATFTTAEFPSFLSQAASCMLLVYLIGQADRFLLLVIGVAVFLYAVLVHFFQPKIQRMSRVVQDEKSRYLTVVEEGISSTREVLAFHRVEWEKKRYFANFERYFANVLKQGHLVNKQLFAGQPLKWGTLLFVLGYGGYLVIAGRVSLGMFVVLYGYTNRFIVSFHGLFEQLMNFSERMGYVERIRLLMTGEQTDEGVLPLKVAVKNIQFENVSFAYEKKQPLVLQGLNITIPAGKKVAFVGTSGGGKSTIAQLLIRFFEPTHGRILVNGLPLSQIRRKDWLERIDIVFQEPYLFPDTIRVNITLGRDEITDTQVTDACKTVQIHHVFASLPNGYDTEVGERGVTLSGGQRQRLALARSILLNPEILILDEATSALDLETERQLQKKIDAVRSGKTTVIIAHRLSTIQNADLIFVMDHGEVVEQGTHQQLMAKGTIYKKLVASRMSTGAPDQHGSTAS
ncbi:MAG: ABC transporter ATP-binding protein [Bacillota bacterium]|nr:ABC transporter ATP-binding protein [Bacillota bacterium]MDW7683507.1 ABC transporter ATP-binding protein [Bacillota bacterium]